MPQLKRRSAVDTTGALLANFSTVAATAVAAPTIADTDRELLALAAELRAAFNDDLAEDDQLEQESFARIKDLIDRMVGLPAIGFAGVAAKAGWICELLAEAGGTAEAELVASVAADLARLMPEAVASNSYAFSPQVAEQEAASPMSGTDYALIALDAELRAAETAFIAAFSEAEAAGHETEDIEQQAFDQLHDLIARMAALPASSAVGIAAKTARLCASYQAARGLMCAEAALVDSFAADLARLVPAAVTPSS